MTAQRPVILISGGFSELPPGDTVMGVSVGLVASPSGLYIQGGALGYNGEALASGAVAQLAANTALASGNGALDLADAAGLLAADALASGNAALTYADTKYAISGGLVDGPMTTVVTALGLYGSGIPCTSGNYFTATLSGDSSVYFTDVPSGSYGLTYEVQYDTGTITWPSGVKWPEDTAPTLTEGTTQLFMLVTDDGGTRWRAASLIDYVT
jgi:hypothetical protein